MARPAVAGAALSLILALVLVGPPQLQASTVPLEQLLLARILTSELTFKTTDRQGRTLNDPSAILSVLRNRQGRGSLVRIMRAYSPHATGAREPRNARQAWVSGLSPQLTRPAAWPHPGWNAMGRPGWGARLAEAGALLAKPLNPCTGEPHHWGGTMDDHRAEAAGWQLLECGPALNHFWCVPARGCPAQVSGSGLP